jgi:hypothetical protein
MSNLTKRELRLAGKYLLSALAEAQTTVRQEQAQENRGYAVSAEDATMLDSQQQRNLRERAVKLAVTNMKADLNL